MPKGFQNDAKMEAQICDCSCFLEEGESWKTVGFSNRKRGWDRVERFQDWLRIYAKSMLKWDMNESHRNNVKIVPKWEPKSHTKWEMEWKRHAKKLCRNWVLRKVSKNVQREGKGSDGSKKWGRGELWATPDGVGGGLPALKGGTLYLGPRAAKVRPESSIRTLYVYWGPTLVRMDQILPRGVLSPWAGFFIFWI